MELNEWEMKEKGHEKKGWDEKERRDGKGTWMRKKDYGWKRGK